MLHFGKTLCWAAKNHRNVTPYKMNISNFISRNHQSYSRRWNELYKNAKLAELKYRSLNLFYISKQMFYVDLENEKNEIKAITQELRSPELYDDNLSQRLILAEEFIDNQIKPSEFTQLNHLFKKIQFLGRDYQIILKAHDELREAVQKCSQYAFIPAHYSIRGLEPNSELPFPSVQKRSFTKRYAP